MRVTAFLFPLFYSWTFRLLDFLTFIMFDTHCHLNFSRFKKNVDEVIRRAQDVGVSSILIPGTDIPTSRKAVEIAARHDGLYAAVGIHPHHVYAPLRPDSNRDFGGVNSSLNIESRQELTRKIVNADLEALEVLVQMPKVVAVGEVGMDRHPYEETKYENYTVDEAFISLQRDLLISQVKLAIKYNKSLILHNREAKADVLSVLRELWSPDLEGRSVFHCCEPDAELLQFAKSYHMFIGVDGDVTYFSEKQEFIKEVPLEMLVVETDSPFLLPEPLKSQRLYPNEPKNIPLIVAFIAQLRGESVEKVGRVTEENANRLFGLAVEKNW